MLNQTNILNLKKIFRKALIWLFINSVIAGIIYSVIYLDFSQNTASGTRWKSFWSVMIISQTVGCFCAAAGYSLSALLIKKSVKVQILLIITGCMLAAIIANGASFYIIGFIYNSSQQLSFMTHFLKKSVVIVLVAATATTITVIIERIKNEKQKFEKNLKEIREAGLKNSIPVKEDEAYYLISYDDLIYISSHGKKTTLHTIEKDYTINRLLKDIESRLSDKFIRIHKQFIINTEYLSQIKYFEGGRYLAYLKDEDESTLPVGRKIAPILKEKLGI